MSTQGSDRDVTRIVRSWLDEGVTALPDRVLDAVLDQVPTTPQRRLWWPVRRFLVMNNTVRFALMAAAVVVLALLGIRFLGPDTNISTPVDTPTPTALASPSATVSAAPLPASGTLGAGRYSVGVANTPYNVELTIGTGWSSGGWYLTSAAGSLSFWTVANVYADACDPGSQSDPPIGASVDDLVSALDAQTNTDLESLGDVNVAHYSGKRVIMRPAVVGCAGSQVFFWQDPNGDPGRRASSTPSAGGEEDVVWILDVEGTRIVIVGYYVPSDPDATTTMLAVIDSIAFVPR